MHNPRTIVSALLESSGDVVVWTPGLSSPSGSSPVVLLEASVLDDNFEPIVVVPSGMVRVEVVFGCSPLEQQASRTTKARQMVRHACLFCLWYLMIVSEDPAGVVFVLQT